MTVAGSTVSFSWGTPTTGAPHTGFLLEASLVSQGPVVGSVQTATTSLQIPGAPNGTFFATVRAVNNAGSGPPSNEVQFTVGSGGCSVAPGAPTSLTASAQADTVSLTWVAPAGGCPPTGYRVRAGSAPGLTNLATLQLGPQTSLSVPGAPPGTYYLTVVAENSFGISAASNEAPVRVGSACTLPGAPISFSAGSNRDIVTLSWAPNPSGGAPTRYVLEIGSTSGATDLGVVRLGVPGLQQPAPNGTYYVRVRGENACGIGPAYVERVLIVSFFPGQ